MNLRHYLGLSLVSLLLIRAHGAETSPLSLSPDNPHYFSFRGETTILIGSSEHYGSVLNLDFDYVRYLDTLQANHLNCARLFTGTYHEAPKDFGILDNTLAPTGASFICPWKRVGDSSGKLDLAQYSPEFFARFRDFLAQAGKRGIVVEVNLFSPHYADTQWAICPMNAANNVNGVGAFPRTDLYTLKHPDVLKFQDDVARKIVGECRDFDNIYFEVCNEPYWGGVTREWEDHMLGIIQDTEKDLPNKHLISVNVTNGSKVVDKPSPGVSIYNFHYCTPPDAVAQNAKLNCVIGDNETGFKGSGDDAYRMEAWDFILAGGGSFMNLDYSFTTGTPDGTRTGYKAPGGGSPALRQQFGYLQAFISTFDVVHMKPDNSVIKSALPKGMTARALVEPGKQYAIYVRGGTQIDLQLELERGTYAVQWLDPLSDKTLKSDQIESKGGTETLSSPAYGKDIALSLLPAKSPQ